MRESLSQEWDEHGLPYHVVVFLLRVALISALGIAGWSIYRDLPDYGAASTGSFSNSREETELLIVLRQKADALVAEPNIPVELYPIDVSLAHQEFLQDPHPGVRFNDYLKRRMKGNSSIKVQLDAKGQATLMVPAGRWWIQASLEGPESIEWMLPVNVAGRHQEVELSSQNAYARVRSF